MMPHFFHALLAQTPVSPIPLAIEYIRILPELVLSVFGAILMLVDPVLDPERNQKPLGLIALIGSLAAFVSVFFMMPNPGSAFWNMVQVDGFSIFFHFLVIAIVIIVILSS